MQRLRIVVASGNPGKLKELNELLAPFEIDAIAQGELGVPEAVEDGLSFVENSIIKARNAAQHSGLPAIADDSGLVVDALNGQPGIYSARFAGINASDADNNAKLLTEMRDVEQSRRTARFFCAAVFVDHDKDPCPLVAQGSWEGQVLTAPRGAHGFGYDPLFLVAGDTRTSAEMPAEEKNRCSHRGRAMQELSTALSKRLDQLRAGALPGS